MIERFKNFVEKRLKFIKLLFVFSVLIFVVYEIGRIFKQIDWGKVQEGLENQSMITIAHTSPRSDGAGLGGFY